MAQKPVATGKVAAKVADAKAYAKMTTSGIILLTPAGLGLAQQYTCLAAYLAVGLTVLYYWLVLSPRAMARHQTKTLRRRIRAKLRPSSGYASTLELMFNWSRLAAVKEGKQARPGLSGWARLTSRPTDYAVRLGRAQYGIRTYARMEDQVLLLAPPRTGKSGLLADRIADHPGGCVATSTRADLYKATLAERAALGPVAVFNPQGVGSVQSNLRFDLLSPCKDLTMAWRMASWLTGGSGETKGSIDWFEDKGKTALTGLLFAAANMGLTIADVFRWNGREGHEIAIAALEANAPGEIVPIVRNALEANRTAASIQATIEQTLAWAAIPEIAAAVTPAPGDDVLKVEDLALNNGTLHLIGSGDEDSPIAPLFRALMSFVHYEAGLIGTRTAAGRLDPPMLLALDEVTQICPVALPQMLSDSAGKGILICPVAHSFSQLEERWGKPGADTIWTTCGTKVMLGGSSDLDTLQRIGGLIGRVRLNGYEVPAATAEFMRTLPRWHAIVVRMSYDPVIVKIRPVWRRPGKRFPLKHVNALRVRHAERAAVCAELQVLDVPAITRPADELQSVYTDIPAHEEYRDDTEEIPARDLRRTALGRTTGRKAQTFRPF